MTVENCLKAYRALGETAFTLKFRLPFPGPTKGAYSSKELKFAIHKSIMDNCQDHQCVMMQHCCHAEDIFQETSCTKTYVFSLSPSQDHKEQNT